MNTTMTITITPLPSPEILIQEVQSLKRIGNQFKTEGDLQSKRMSRWIQTVDQDADQNEDASLEEIVGIATDRLRELRTILSQCDHSLFVDPVKYEPVVMSRWLYEAYRAEFPDSSPFNGQPMNECETHSFAQAMVSWMKHFIENTGIARDALKPHPHQIDPAHLENAATHPQLVELQVRPRFLMELSRQMMPVQRDLRLIEQVDSTQDRIDGYIKQMRNMERQLTSVENQLALHNDYVEQQLAVIDQIHQQALQEVRDEAARYKSDAARERELNKTQTQTYSNNLTSLGQSVTNMDQAHQRKHEAKEQQIQAINQAHAQITSHLQGKMAANDRAHQNEVVAIKQETHQTVTQLRSENSATVAILQQTQASVNHLQAHASNLQGQVNNLSASNADLNSRLNDAENDLRRARKKRGICLVM